MLKILDKGIKRLIKRRQTTRVKRIRKDTIYIGTWNVMTMLKAGKMIEIADEMLKTQLQIIALQELRWKGLGKLIKLNIRSTIAVKLINLEMDS